MKPLTEAYDFLGESLSGATRSDRRAVLVYSTVCLLVAYTGIVPTDPSILGFKFPKLTEHLLYWILFGFLAFSYLCFSVRFLTDYRRYRFLRDRLDFARARQMDDAMHTLPEDDIMRQHHEEDFAHNTGYRAYKIGYRSTKILGSFRLFLDCGVPLVFGAVSMSAMLCVLLNKMCSLN